MPRVSGPTIPRWRLGEELARLRTAAGLTWAEVADQLGCSESKVRKIEGGHVGVIKAELNYLLDLYAVDEPLRESLWELQKLGKQRGWWSQFGSVPKDFATFLALESSATTIKTFEPLVIPGLLQTEAYSRAVESTLDDDEEAVERSIQIRLARQQRIWQDGDPPHVWAVVDECVLHRVIGGEQVMRAQLEHLLTMADRCTVQVMPFSVGGYPGTLGAFTLFDFDEATHSPVAYVEGQAGNLYLERTADLSRCIGLYKKMTATASSPPESLEMIKEAVQRFG